MKDSPAINAYIAQFPADIQELLQELRQTIRASAPRAEETINYGIPTFTQNGNLVHFGAHRHHIGFYPGPSAVRKFSKELSAYKQTRGTIQFPLDEDLPLEIVKKIVTFRVGENMAKKKTKQRS